MTPHGALTGTAMFHKYAKAATFQTKIALLPPVQFHAASRAPGVCIEGLSLPEIFPELRFASQPSWFISLYSLISLPAKEQSGDAEDASRALPEDHLEATRLQSRKPRSPPLFGSAGSVSMTARCCSDPNLEPICYASCVRQCGPPGSRAAVGFGTQSATLLPQWDPKVALQLRCWLLI